MEPVIYNRVPSRRKGGLASQVSTQEDESFHFWNEKNYLGWNFRTIYVG
jgi:hypothetical protein